MPAQPDFAPLRRCWPWVALPLALAWGLLPVASRSAQAQRPTAAEESGEPLDVQRLEGQVQQLLLTVLPHDYENDKKWGRTREIVTGLKIYRDGLRIKTRRRRSRVNDGTWIRYRVSPVHPEQHLHLRLKRLEPLESGQLAISAEVDARLHLEGRWAQWETGLQLLSIGANAIADVRLILEGRIGLQLDPTKLPPDVLLSAEVTDADIQLRDFRLLDLSDLRGAVAHQLGKNLRELVEDEIQDRRPQIVQKMNQQIEKKEDELRLSLEDLARSKWNSLINHLPEQPSDEQLNEK